MKFSSARYLYKETKVSLILIIMNVYYRISCINPGSTSDLDSYVVTKNLEIAVISAKKC